MSQGNTQGNGCSLEDCHTNLFALTDLDGIKWRRLVVPGGPNYCLEPLDDPVLASFSRCIQSDVLCVWRRGRRSAEARTHNQPDQLSCNKELWIFWYGDEPANLSTLLASELQEEDSGCWDQGLDYECRTLLFKALHSLIERCLLSQNFVRVGKWFVQPYDYGSTPTVTDRSAHLSIRFSFFLHGESQVCASIDVRQHTPLRRLNVSHLNSAAHGHPNVQVILAPYGLAGVLTGQTFKEGDLMTQKLMDEWRQFYVVKDPSCKEGENRLPPAVEVIVAGVRMRYPTNFVLITAEMEDELFGRHGNAPLGMGGPQVAPPQQASNLLHGMTPLTPPTSPVHNQLGGGDSTALRMTVGPVFAEGQLEQPSGLPNGDIISDRIVSKVWQDCHMSGSSQTQRIPHQGGGDSGGMEDSGPAGNWDFSEFMQKNTCHCSKGKGGKQRGLSGSASKSNLSNLNKKGERDKAEKPTMRHGRGAPFHRRSTLSDDLLQQEIDLMAQTMPGSYDGFKGQTPQGTPRLPQLQNTNFDDSIDSPNSAAPSPLVAPQNQSSMNHNGDPTMPTLSPHPPAKNGDKDMNSSTGGSTDSQLPDTGTGTTNGPTDTYVKPASATPTPTTKIDTYTSPYHSVAVSDSRTDPVNNWLDAQRQVEPHGLKRPRLPSKTYDDMEHELITEALYDFKSVDAWLEHPVKRHRSDLRGERPLQLPAKARPPSPPKEPHDPYEFTEDSSNSVNLDRKRCFPRPSHLGRHEDSRRSSESSFGLRDDRKSSLEMSPSTPGAVGPGGPNNMDPMGQNQEPFPLDTRPAMMKDIHPPTMNDLDKLFDTDSESSEPDTFQAPTPPGGTKSGDEQKMIPGKGGGPTQEVMDHSELSRMFPTPPSLENNHNALSPCNNTETATESQTVDHHHHNHPLSHVVAKIEPHILTTSCEESSIKDWTFVFRPPTMAKFIGSAKYGPIELPSSRLPPLPLACDLNYKPSWHYPLPIIDKQHQPPPTSHYTNVPSVDPSLGGARTPGDSRMGAIETSPATVHIGKQHTPLSSYEMQSPASNASSYMNKNLNSIDNHGTNSQFPEVHSLVVNILLSDSMLNLFKDHNFDSCTICVCNNNIKGADMALYLVDHNVEDQFPCRCGFSAVVNRKYSTNSGLFYEDEVEITGLRNERLEQSKPSLLALDLKASMAKETLESAEQTPREVLLQLQGQFATLFPTFSVLHHSYPRQMPLARHDMINLLEIQDGCEACYSALEAGRQAADNCNSSKLDDPLMKSTCLHKWSYLQDQALVPGNSTDVYRLLRSLQRLLQDTLQKKRTTDFWESVYTVSGPLTWKDFHLLAGRGSEEVSEPQPIPSLLAGYDKDWLSLSPHAVRYWDKLLLEPYARPRDVAYVVVAPDNDYVISHVKSFFKELSTVYELCNLGRHCPISKVLRDGIMRVGRAAASRLSDQPVSDWFKLIGNSPAASKLRLYAQVCRHHLAPFLATQQLDKSLFEPSGNASKSSPPKMHSEPSPAPPTPDSHGSAGSSQAGGQTPNHNGEEKGDVGDHSSSERPTRETAELETEAESGECPAIVIYMVEPFTYAQHWEDLSRLGLLGLLRCFQEMFQFLPEHIQANVQLQVVPLQSILDFRDYPTSQFLKTLALSVYTQCRRQLSHNILGRSLTGFGPAAAAEKILKSKEAGHVGVSKLFSPPFILASHKDKQSQLAESWGERVENSGTLLVAYCLSSDQRWLLAVCADSCGEILETCTINIEIPNRNRRKKASARRIGLAKLWDFVVGVISQTCMPWRLIIGRFGRMGHGELQGWAGLLSRKHLLASTKQLHQMCNLCEMRNGSDLPSIQSACLVSMEVHQSIHVFTDSVKEEEVRSSNCPLNTPKDASTTHILVFPTSTTARTNTASPVNEDPALEEDFFPNPSDGDFNFDEDFSNALGDMGDIFAEVPVSPPKNLSAPPSPKHLGGDQHLPTKPGKSEGLGSMEAQDNPNATLLQQPLAMGFYLSTAPTGPLPSWIWSACPHQEKACPVCFKAALHINCSSVHQNSDDFGHHPSQNRHSHPLDSNFTCDVLRYVLETYNALSWLSIDPVTNDRRSCLPAHFVVLMQLYHAMDKFV